jgi:hypothetical protein
MPNIVIIVPTSPAHTSSLSGMNTKCSADCQYYLPYKKSTYPVPSVRVYSGTIPDMAPPHPRIGSDEPIIELRLGFIPSLTRADEMVLGSPNGNHMDPAFDRCFGSWTIYQGYHRHTY